MKRPRAVLASALLLLGSCDLNTDECSMHVVLRDRLSKAGRRGHRTAYSDQVRGAVVRCPER